MSGKVFVAIGLRKSGVDNIWFDPQLIYGAENEAEAALKYEGPHGDFKEQPEFICARELFVVQSKADYGAINAWPRYRIFHQPPSPPPQPRALKVE
jgi:hypothetical protein